MKPFKSVLMVILAVGSGTLSAANDVWTSLGPGGGEIERLVVDPATPSILYAVAGGGVFKTVNGGITLTMPSALDANLRADMLNGNLTSEFPVSVTSTDGPRRVSGTIGRGGLELNLSTVNGSIRLLRAP